MHGTPRWNHGSRKRLARLRLRGNWPRLWELLGALVAMLALWLANLWAHHEARGLMAAATAPTCPSILVRAEVVAIQKVKPASSLYVRGVTK
jgi:hypothetical protein